MPLQASHPKETEMPFSVGPMELVIVLVLALLVLGPKRLPEAGKAVGRGLREFKNSVTGGSEDEKPLAEPARAD
jgi:sec-independent protein translocase protein TatA